MKKLVILFLSVLTTGFLMTSCSDDDEDSATIRIEGKWEFYQVGYLIDGVEQLESYTHTPGCAEDFIDFKLGGNYEEVYYSNNGGGCEVERNTGSWSKSGDVLTITNEDNTFNATILTLNSTTLKASTTYVFEGISVTDIVVFKRP